MASDKKGFGGSIGGPRGATPINSHAIVEGDGTNRRPDSEKGAGSITDGAYSHRGPITKDPKVRGAGPSPAGRPRQP